MTTLVIDVFPAILNTSSGTYDSVRVLSDGATLWVFRLSGNEITLAKKFDVTNVDASPARGAYTATDVATGEEISVSMGGGCGCGNPLKRQPVETLLALVPA